LRAHALDTSSDTDLDHASLDRIGDINARLQTRRALSVQGLDGSRHREAGREGRSTEFGGATSWGQDGADSDILDEGGVNLRAVDERLEGSDKQICSGSVLETSLAALCDGRPEARCHDDLDGDSWSATPFRSLWLMTGETHIVRALPQ
jgi:hypothetical protein